jgi:hypothetical protein
MPGAISCLPGVLAMIMHAMHAESAVWQQEGGTPAGGQGLAQLPDDACGMLGKLAGPCTMPVQPCLVAVNHMARWSGNAGSLEGFLTAIKQ